MIETCMRPALTYAFSVAPYSKAELRSLDALLTKATKKAFGISATTSTALAHEDTVKGGLASLVPWPFIDTDIGYHGIADNGLPLSST
jgi:hypothetical protein